MINLKRVLTEYPECYDNVGKFKATLSDLYPEEQRYVSLLARFLDDGVFDQIKNKDEISSAEFTVMRDKFARQYGVTRACVSECVVMMAFAFNVFVNIKVEPTKQSTKKTKSAEYASHRHKYTSTVVPPTCTEKGYTLHSCDCGHEYKDNFTNPKHDYELIERREPTCEEDGKELYRCVHCGREETKILEATGHEFGEWIKPNEPICEHDGSETRVCSRCGKTETRDIKATGHKFSEFHKEGNDYVTSCSQCGLTIKRGLPILKEGQIIEFGRYSQRNDESKDAPPIKWIVLEVKDEKALLLSAYTLGMMPYSDDKCCATSASSVGISGKQPYKKQPYARWENSSIRTWLNTKFMETAFDDQEKRRILTTKVKATVLSTNECFRDVLVNYRWPPLKDEKRTKTTVSDDKVFLLDIHEANKYSRIICRNVWGTTTLRDVYVMKGCRLGRFTTCFMCSQSKVLSVASLPLNNSKLGFQFVGSQFNYPIRPAIFVDLLTSEEREQKEQERKKREREEKEEQERKKREREELELRRQRRLKHVCQYCGGKFKGFFKKTCSRCGKKKDYYD